MFKNTSHPNITGKLRGHDIYILATTGAGLIRALAPQFIPQALSSGSNITVLIPNSDSPYIDDVAEVEARKINVDDTAKEKANQKKRLRDEFASVVQYLREGQSNGIQMNSTGCGKIYLGCAYTLLRQTVTLAADEDTLWGWMSLTVPPFRTVDGTPSIELNGSKSDSSLAKLVYEHILAIRDIAVARGTFFAISDCPDDFEQFFLENETAESFWTEKYRAAQENMRACYGNAELIEVAAQHPLQPDGKPGKEFSERLKYALRLYRDLKEEGCDVQIYVPGSVHCFRGRQDPCSLSAAGVAFLKENGIPESDLLGEEMNEKYKGEKGVYNTADECYVASRIFQDGLYARLHSVCSPNQLMREKLFYIYFGVIPYYHTVNTDSMAHNDMYEIFHSIPDIIFKDHSWQRDDSVNGNRTRNERDPRFVYEGDPSE